MYCAIIGDIVGSRNLEDRSAKQNVMKDVLADINDKYANKLSSAFTITLGDEFQGLLFARDADLITDIITVIKSSMYPVRVRFGIGIGEMNTDIDRNASLGADGPAYHRARAMVEKLKTDEKKNEAVMTDAMLSSRGEDEQEAPDDEIFNAVMALCYLTEQKWTKRQREIIADYVVHGKNQRKTAERLNIAPSSVNRALKASGYFTYEHARITIRNVLTRRWQHV